MHTEPITAASSNPPATGASHNAGSPRFARSDLQAIAGASGAAAAWARLFTGAAPERDLADVTGPFAVALRLDDGRAWLAVDRFAVHSLCYRVVDGRIVFSPRADLLADATTAIDLQAIYDYLYFHAIPSPRTVFQGVHRVPPGHLVSFVNGQVRVAPYWQPRFEPQADRSFDALAAEFRELLRQAVADRIDPARPACFLSGGTDSSTVAGMIGLAAGRPAATYSIGFGAEGYDEMAYARIAARHFGTDHHEYYVTADDLVAGIPQMAAHFDQPFGNSSALPTYCCARMARDDGVTRLLAGDGGDELFGGNARYAKQRVFDVYGNVPAPLRRHLVEPLLAQKALHAVPLLRKGASYVEQARLPMPARLEMYNLLPRLGVADVLSAEFVRRVDPRQPLQQQQAVWDAAQAHDPIDRSLAFDWRYTLSESDLPKVCGGTSLAGVEVAFPLLDDRLLAFSMRLPAHYKLKGLQLRWFFKQALRDFLPPEILSKQKHGFGLPFGVWATQHPGLRQLAEASLSSLSQRGLFRPEFIQRLLHRLLPEHPGYYGEMVWIMMMLEQWLLRHRPGFRLDDGAAG